MITVHGANTTLTDLRRIPLIRPDGAGKVWRGIQHGELVDTILGEIGERGWEIKDQRFSIGGDGANLAAAFDLDIPKLLAPEGTGFSLGLLTDNRREKALRLYAGANVTVCNNGLATGEIVLKHKHTVNFRLREEICEAMDEYLSASRRVGGMIDGLKVWNLSLYEYEHLLLESARKGFMPWSRLSYVDREFHQSSFGFGSDTSWDLLNAFTHVAKRNPPGRQLEQINGFRAMLPVAVAV